MKIDLLNPLRWNKQFLIALLAAFVVVWFSFIDVYSLKTRWDLNEQKKDLEFRTEELAAKAEELKNKTELLESDPALLEKIAREEYGMRKPGETVYKVKPEN